MNEQMILEQIKIYKNDGTGKYYWLDFLTFILAPIGISIIVAVNLPLLKKYTKTLIKHEARLNISGDKSQLPERLVKEIDKVIEKTNHFTQKTLNIALNYGSRTEIVRAVNNIIKEGVSDISEEEFSKYLYTANLPDVDLIVRTSGESRLSNFLLYQSAYAELYFTDVLWPDFSEEELDKALVWYDGRDRRYGNIK